MNSTKRSGTIIQARDRHLLREFDVLRVADRQLVQIVGGFGSISRTNRRLRALSDAGLLRRTFLGTGSAGRKAIYRLSPEGARIADVPYRGIRRGADEITPKDFFVEHQLAVNSIYAALKYRPMPVTDTEFVRWRSFYGPIAEAIPLTPDGYALLKTPLGVIGHFLEVDLGTERRSVWKAKVENYLQLSLSDNRERLIGERRFRVLVIANSARRLQSIRAVVAGIVDMIFWFTTLGDIAGDAFFRPVWLRPVGETRVSLIGKP